VEKSDFEQLVRGIFAHSPAGSDDFIGMAFFTNDGVLAIPSESTGKIGFGIATGITPTSGLLSTIGDLNRLMTFGHYWLAPGSDDDHWSLICGFKFQYDTVGAEHVAEIAAAVMKHNATLIASVRSQIEDVPHREYWLSDGQPGAQAIALMSHLG
jgi:hypothetical protein